MLHKFIDGLFAVFITTGIAVIWNGVYFIWAMEKCSSLMPSL